VIWSLEVHEESVDSEDSQLLVLLSIVGEIKINHLFHDHVVSARCFDHLRVQTRHVDSQRHVSDHLFYDVTLLILVALETDGAQQKSKLVNFAFFVVYKELWNG